MEYLVLLIGLLILFSTWIKWKTFYPPDRIIGENYLSRWYIIPKNRYFNIYLHKFTGSDDDRALHDHPWNSVSFLLKGKVAEMYKLWLVPGQWSESGVRKRFIKRFKPVFRPAYWTHRIIVADGPVWTLFITGPKKREWGFWCPHGWVHWRKFTDDNGNSIGRGCG